MNNFDRIYNNIFNNVFSESIIDISRNSLDPTVFQFPEDGYPILQPEIKLQIIENIKTIDNIITVKNYFIIGKILSPKYRHNNEIPIDVNVEVESDKVNPLNSEVLFKLIKRMNGRLATGSTHPINYYIIQNEYNLDKTPYAYNVDSEKWIKTPSQGIKESVIDYAHKSLDPQLWDIKKQPPTLKPDVKDLIISELKKYFGNKYDQYVDEIHLTGSIGTQQWKSNTDIDVHILPRDIEFNKQRYENTKSKIINDFKKKGLTIGKHPIEVYLQLDPGQETRGDASYDVINDKWIKMPFTLSSNFDPDIEFAYLKKNLSKIFNKMDSALGELRRDLIDFDIIEDYLGNLQPGEKTWLKEKLDKKLNEIEDDINVLVKQKDKYHELRKRVYSPEDQESAWKDVLKSKSWAPSNIMWKMLDRYKYISLILSLQNIMKDGDNNEVEPSDVEKIKDTIGIKEYFTEKTKGTWKDPLNRHSMKSNRGHSRKNQKWVPRSRQTEISITRGQKVLDLAKEKAQGIWQISYPEAIAIAAKYKMHLPNRRKRAKRLGSTGIVMWLKLRPNEPARMFLVKHDKLLKGILGRVTKKKKKKMASIDSSKYKAKKPMKLKKTAFKKHHVGVRGI